MRRRSAVVDATIGSDVGDLRRRTPALEVEATAEVAERAIERVREL